MDDEGARVVELDDGDGFRQWATRGEGGSLRLHGQDVNAGKLAEIFGPGVDEYEWVHTVTPDDVPRLLSALGEPPGSDLLEVAQRHADVLFGGGLARWFERVGIEPEYWSRTGTA